MAQNRSLNEVLHAIVRGLASCPNVALTRIWLLNPGDRCQSCRFRSECTDQTRCLHLAASAGNARTPNTDLSGIQGAFQRFPLGQRKIGQVAASGEPLLLRRIQGNEAWIANPAWFQHDGIQTFAAQPLIFRDEILGVLALFDREILSDHDFSWMRVFADHAAVSITNANAFEEIAYLKERLEEENTVLRREVSAAAGAGDLIGTSAATRKVFEQIQLVASTDATVLVTGESGTGKELVARAIHEGSPRKGGAMIKVNCSAIPEALFESEFFGHVKGAFTGALRDKPGRFELANRGTLFLDEVGEIPLPMQAKLLRVLQEQELERVGDTRPRKVDVRIIAATNRNLKNEVQEGRFRQDLFYRLSVFPIEIPPLRERPEDIPILAEVFLKAAGQRLNRKAPKLTQATARLLTAYPWPGNVRELQNAVERAVILARSGPLIFDFLSTAGLQAPIPRALATDAAQVDSPLLTRSELKRQERDNIATALEQTHGRIFGSHGAAALLGMKPTTLASRIKALGIRSKS